MTETLDYHSPYSSAETGVSLAQNHERQEWERLNLTDLPLKQAPTWQTTDSNQIYQSPWMTVRLDDLVLENGTMTSYGLIEKKRFVMIIAENALGDILCVLQYRYPVKAWLVEFPCGEIHDNESLEDAAARELAEETGYQASEWSQLGRFYEGASFSTHHAEVMHGKVKCPEKGLISPEPCEQGITAGWLTPEEILLHNREGHIVDGPTLAGLFLFEKLKRERVNAPKS